MPIIGRLYYLGNNNKKKFICSLQMQLFSLNIFNQQLVESVDVKLKDTEEYSDNYKLISHYEKIL